MTRFQISLGILLIIHLVGSAGLHLHSTREVFEKISWINLLVSYLLLLINFMPLKGIDTDNLTNDKSRIYDFNKILIFTFLIVALGISVEIAGVHTGVLFGKYYYTPTLGFSIYSVPIIIGINWALLVYVSGCVINQWFGNRLLKVFLGAIFLTLLDILLERFAIHHYLWVWIIGGSPPLLNYFGWFVTSLLFHGIFQGLLGKHRNNLAIAYLLILLGFLIADNI